MNESFLDKCLRVCIAQTHTGNEIGRLCATRVDFHVCYMFSSCTHELSCLQHNQPTISRVPKSKVLHSESPFSKVGSLCVLSLLFEQHLLEERGFVPAIVFQALFIEPQGKLVRLCMCHVGRSIFEKHTLLEHTEWYTATWLFASLETEPSVCTQQFFFVIGGC